MVYPKNVSILTAPGFKVKLIIHHRPVSTATNRSLLAHRYNFVGNSSGILFTLTLPHIPVAKQQANQSWTTLLGLDAFALFKNKRMAIFFIFSMLLGAELQITNMFGNTFLHSFDKDPMFASSFIVQHASIIMSISQISETLFILTIPFFLSRYGIKNVMMISIVAWILRFALFAYVMN